MESPAWVGGVGLGEGGWCGCEWAGRLCVQCTVSGSADESEFADDDVPVSKCLVRPFWIEVKVLPRVHAQRSRVDLRLGRRLLGLRSFRTHRFFSPKVF